MGGSIRALEIAGVVGVAALCCIEATVAQTVCREAKVTAFDGGLFQMFGRAVALSGDTALVGAHWDNDLGTQSGSAYVYLREPGPDGNWVFAQKLLASDGGASEHFGRSVAIDGDTAMVGATAHLHDEDGGNGSVYVFKYDGATWIQQQELIASDGALGDVFARSVAISADVALIGAPSDDDDGFASGSVYVFRFDPKFSQWIEVQKLTASDAMTSDGFGASVALAGDLAVIGTPGQDGVEEETGAAYIFRFDSDTATWIEQAKVFASDGTVLDRFGRSVAVSSDSIGVALVGAHGAQINTGAAYVFRFDPKTSTWFQEQKLVASGGSPEQFGRAVAMDGDTALIGSWAADAVGPNYGAAYVFRYDPDSSQWSQADMLVPDPGPWTAFFGWAVAMDGETAVIGAHGEDQQRGAAYMFAGLDGIDCNRNGAADSCDILAGVSKDENGNGVPDECEGIPCPWDLDGNTDVGVGDLLILLGAWGPNPGHPADFDGNDDVGVSDLLAVLANWGPCP